MCVPTSSEGGDAPGTLKEWDAIRHRTPKRSASSGAKSGSSEISNRTGGGSDDIQAEEWGLTQATVADGLTSDNPSIVQFLGGENADGTTLDPGLGLDPAFAYNIIEQVGNYGEIF